MLWSLGMRRFLFSLPLGLALSAMPPVEVQFHAFTHHMQRTGFPGADLQVATAQLAFWYVDRADYHFAWTIGVMGALKGSQEVRTAPYGLGTPVIQQDRTVYSYRPAFTSGVQFLWGDQFRLGISPELRLGRHRQYGTWESSWERSDGVDTPQVGLALLAQWASAAPGVRLGLRVGQSQELDGRYGQNRELGITLGWQF